MNYQNNLFKNIAKILNNNEKSIKVALRIIIYLIKKKKNKL